MPSDLNDLDREFADLDGGAGPARARAKAPSRALPIAVAAIAIVGFAGIVWYAYSQGVRSGSEVAAPLLEPDGPAKVAPADPGGLEVPHRDKSVYECTLNPDQCDDRVERILPPPEDPMRPVIPDAPEETAVTGQAGEVAPPPPPPLVSAPGEGAETPGALAVPPPPPPTLTAEGSAPADTQQAAAPPPEPAREPPSEPEPEPDPDPAPAPEPEAQPAPTAPADLAASVRIQIGALRDEQAARAEWTRRQGQFADLLGDLSVYVQRVDAGDRGVFYRVQGGPLASVEAAGALCERLKERGLDCLVVRP